MFHRARSRRLGIAPLVGLICLIAAFAAPLARAGTPPPSVPGCGTQTFSQPFLRFADPAWYVPAPRGSFETGLGGWTLTGQWGLTSVNEPFLVNSLTDKHSLVLASGSSATSPPVCVSLYHPTLRFFARGVVSGLNVKILYRDVTGATKSLLLGTVLPSGAWAPTAPMVLVANVLSELPGDHTWVWFRFVPQTTSTWQIDDVYVDPWRKG